MDRRRLGSIFLAIGTFGMFLSLADWIATLFLFMGIFGMARGWDWIASPYLLFSLFGGGIISLLIGTILGRKQTPTVTPPPTL